MGLEAATKALLDAGLPGPVHIIRSLTEVRVGITYDAVETAFVGYVYGDSTSGQVHRLPFNRTRATFPLTSAHRRRQRALYNLGLTGIPVTNVNNNCSTGSTALYNANNAVVSGMVECALALGFERMAPGSLGTTFPDRPSPIQPFNDATKEIEPNLSSGVNHGPGAPRMFANAAQEYMDKYGATERHLAQIG